MNGKYTSALRYIGSKVSRAGLRRLLRLLIRWPSRCEAGPGYTVIIGCKSALSAMLGVNLRLLERQRREHLREVIVVWDCVRAGAMAELESKLRAAVPDLPLRFCYYTARQARITSAIEWGWVYSWLSWCTGIAEARTRYVILHDFDALLLRPEVLEDRYREISRGEAEYVGVRYYDGNGVKPEDGLVTTFELILDAAYIREHFEPIDIFNHVTMYHGRSVDFDTFLLAQSRGGRKAVLPVEEEDMVHPSQMICQFTDHMAGRMPALEANNLLLIPYFAYLSGDAGLLIEQQMGLDRRRGTTVECFGKPVDLSRLSPVHARWLTKQAYRLERALSGEVRREVRAYFESIESIVEPAAGGARAPAQAAPMVSTGSAS